MSRCTEFGSEPQHRCSRTAAQTSSPTESFNKRSAKGLPTIPTNASSREERSSSLPPGSDQPTSAQRSASFAPANFIPLTFAPVRLQRSIGVGQVRPSQVGPLHARLPGDFAPDRFALHQQQSSSRHTGKIGIVNVGAFERSPARLPRPSGPSGCTNIKLRHPDPSHSESANQVGADRDELSGGLRQ